MASSGFSTTVSTTNSTNSSESVYDGGIGTQIAFGMVAGISVVGNALVFIVLMYSRKLRSYPHGVLIWNLALVDFLTGIFIIVTPEHIIRDGYIQPPPGLGAHIFCVAIGSEVFTFGFGFISMYTLVVLGIERRYAVVKANLHPRYFTLTRTRIMLVFVWIWGFVLVLGNLWQTHYYPDENPSCVWKNLPDEALHFTIYSLYFFLRFLLPMVMIIACYLNILRYMRTTIRSFSDQMKRNTAAYKMRNKITITCAVTSLAFFLCWLPNIVYFTLANLNLLKTGNDGHFLTKLLVLLNSAINPFIYASTNPYYRQEFRKMLHRFQCLSNKKHKPNPGITNSFKIPEIILPNKQTGSNPALA
ncbi:uncharacterized protein TRIADDRAFT_59518 [Trichoplax adhaerens]|uniref:G-protein coupled receptors family 1 profile domain-containing protein n=1 Tax=Trichoplax adhaerens TaxID=10228 RepID=B3S5M5_TRIAD|nr:hypothetical protein TRIADDRAFT_59518 [Trichoplax adhaerens]EDV21983.1 hypothetical protein TRIADDRAFT_59518 [Trichoplax adhaerens]|eukprot:XP_002115620.1 hypothetical protein TRIADDRAFT_59518 [Trichoplax adhaerens]